MKTILNLSFVFMSLIATAQNRAQTMVLIPENFTLKPRQIKTSSGKSFCLEIQNSLPFLDSDYSIEMLKNLKIIVGNAEAISLAEAQKQGILHLVNHGFGYFFKRGKKYLNKEITIQMSDKLRDNIVSPKGVKVDVTNFTEILNNYRSSITSDNFQGDLWFHQLKNELFKQVNSKSELNSPRKIHTKKADEFLEDVKKVLDDDIYCKPTEAELCLTKGEVPVVSFSFKCDFMEITISTDAEISVGRSIRNKYISLTEEKTFKLHDLFKKDTKLDESEKPCSWNEICFNINKYDKFPKPTIPNCSITDAILNKKISISNEKSGKTISLSFN